MIEVFKTNIEDDFSASRILDLLNHRFPGCRINFDLQDCDKILRIEGLNFQTDMVRGIVERVGFDCAILD